MSELFDAADDLLNEELDKFMEIIKRSESEFYDKYFAARIIKDTGIRHRSVEEQPVPAELK
jgi:hypothetical protein